LEWCEVEWGKERLMAKPTHRRVGILRCVYVYETKGWGTISFAKNV